MTSHSELQHFLAVQVADYQAYIDVLEHDFKLEGLSGNIRLHHLKCDGNGRPMVTALAEMLYNYIIEYCIASKNRPEPLTSQQWTRLVKEARGLFRRLPIKDGEDDVSGEAGETLLFFLTEAVLQAPQIVAKMELKTNHKDEIKGSDGVHARWNENDGVVDFYFGESKLYKDVTSAISSALKSISQFHDTASYKHELTIVTKHFKYADEEVRKQIANLITNGEAGAGARLNHACLIGYDWKAYQTLSIEEIKNNIKLHLLAESANIVDNLNKKLAKFDKKFLRFDIFFMPFPSVAEFRNAFNLALG